MDEKPPFDMVRATFFLVAAVFAIYSFAALFGEIACITANFIGVPLPSSCGSGKLAEAFGTLLASALAYAAGQRGSSK